MKLDFAEQGIPGKVTETIYLGAEIRYTVQLENGQTVEVSRHQTPICIQWGLCASGF